MDNIWLIGLQGLSGFRGLRFIIIGFRDLGFRFGVLGFWVDRNMRVVTILMLLRYSRRDPSTNHTKPMLQLSGVPHRRVYVLRVLQKVPRFSQYWSIGFM